MSHKIELADTEINSEQFLFDNLFFLVILVSQAEIQMKSMQNIRTTMLFL